MSTVEGFVQRHPVFTYFAIVYIGRAACGLEFGAQHVDSFPIGGPELRAGAGDRLVKVEGAAEAVPRTLTAALANRALLGKKSRINADADEIRLRGKSRVSGVVLLDKSYTVRIN